MARDWDENMTMAKLARRLADITPDNAAPVPFAVSHERDEETGKMVWRVDLHVHIRGVTEYDIEGWSDISLSDALRRAYIGLCSETRLRSFADASNARFGVTV